MIIGPSYNLSHINHIPNINIQGHSIERVDQFKQLGVTIDDQLKWDKHVDTLCKKLSSALFSIRQVKFLPKSYIFLTLYRSLVESRLRYFWGNCGISLTKSLVELINSDSELVNLNAAFKELSLLDVQQLIDYNTTTMVYDSIHGNCPEYLADLFIPACNIQNHQTRHACNGLFPTHMNLVAGQRSFLNRGCHLWNSLPQTLQSAPTPQSFKNNLFKYIMELQL